jgi:predicted Zn-dependent protease
LLKLCRLVALLVVLGCFQPALAQVRLPDPTEALSSPGMERMAGVLFSRRFEKAIKERGGRILPVDAPESLRVQKVTDQLARVVALDRPNLVFQARVVKDPGINALCIPGGYLYVYTGLLEHIDKKHPDHPEDALAAVLGHEIAHAVLRHGLQSWAGSDDFRSVLKDEEIFTRLLLAASRSEELEADRYGALYALRAGYRFTSVVDVLERFPKTRRLLAPGPATHPEGADRARQLEKFRAQLEQMVRLWEESLKAAACGRFESAAIALEILEAEFPNLPSVHNNLGWVYYQTYETTCPQRPEQQLSYSYVTDLGVRVRAVGEADLLTLREAERAFQQAIRLNPNLAEAYEGAALCAAEQGRFEEARSLLRSALQLAPDRPSVLNLAGVLRERQQLPEEALAAYEKATEADPAFLPALFNLGRLQHGLGRSAEARENLERYLSQAGPGPWKERARIILSDRPAPLAAPPTGRPLPVRSAAGIRIGDSPEAVASALGPPSHRLALPNGTELRVFGGRGVDVWLSPGVTMICLKSPTSGEVDGLAVGAVAEEAQARLGPPALRRAADRGLEHWSYPSRGYTLGVREGKVAEILVGAVAR